MAAGHFRKYARCWLVVFPCLLSAGSAAVSLGYPSASAVHGGRLTPAQCPRPAPPGPGAVVTASWYGRTHHNRPTASGQRFDMFKKTLAHRTLPLGTRVLLVNPDNGRSVEGTINDRGPYIAGRDVDVSYAMARQLGFVEQGVVKLGMEMIKGVGKQGRTTFAAPPEEAAGAAL